MKRTCYPLLLLLLAGCGLSAGDSARNLSSGVNKCCANLSLNKTCFQTKIEPENDPQNQVISSSLLDRSGKVFTW